jgi:guanine deaminase
MSSNPNPAFMQRAIQLATENVRNGLGGPFGAVIVRDGRIIGEGANLVTATNDPTAHGEIIAIRNACQAIASFSLQGCAIYTSCEPCPMCLSACYWSRLDAIYFGCSAADAARAGFDDAFLYAEFQKDQKFRTLPARQMLADEARASFDAWLASPIKIAY